MYYTPSLNHIASHYNFYSLSLVKLLFSTSKNDTIKLHDITRTPTVILEKLLNEFKCWIFWGGEYLGARYLRSDQEFFKVEDGICPQISTLITLDQYTQQTLANTSFVRRFFSLVYAD